MLLIMSCSGSVGSWLQRYSLFFSAGRTKKYRLCPNSTNSAASATFRSCRNPGRRRQPSSPFRAVIVARPGFERGHSRVRLITEDGKISPLFSARGPFHSEEWHFLRAVKFPKRLPVMSPLICFCLLCPPLIWGCFFFSRLKWHCEMNHFIIMFTSFRKHLSLWHLCVPGFFNTHPPPSFPPSPFYSCFLLCVDYWFLVYKMSPCDIQQSLQ